MGGFAEVGSNLLLFFLVFGMSATTDIGHVRKQLRNRNALLTGISLQFIILPFVGFVIVKILNMDAPLGITLLVVTSSPGGSYSNWWCSMFNADLALSVTMTAISTLLSVIMLPVNLVLYATNSYSSAVVKSLDWSALFVSLIVVIGGIVSGVVSSAAYNSHRFNILANKLGNIAGISLIAYSAFVSSSGEGASLWNQGPTFYIGVASPAVIGVCIATYMASKFKLDKPERVSVAVEACYQNTGIATSVAITMFKGEDLATAISVPLCYGIFEAIILACYCVVCWKLGWTKAPADENICAVLMTSYEVETSRMESPNAIEVVYNTTSQGDYDDQQQRGNGGTTAIEDLVFTSTNEGYKIDEESLHETTNARLEAGGGMHSTAVSRRIPSEDSDSIPAEGRTVT